MIKQQQHKTTYCSTLSKKTENQFIYPDLKYILVLKDLLTLKLQSLNLKPSELSHCTLQCLSITSIHILQYTASQIHLKIPSLPSSGSSVDSFCLVFLITSLINPSATHSDVEVGEKANDHKNSYFPTLALNKDVLHIFCIYCSMQLNNIY